MHIALQIFVLWNLLVYSLTCVRSLVRPWLELVINCSKLSLRVHIKCNFPNSWCTSNMVNKWKSRSVHSKVNFSFKAKQLGRDLLKLLLNLHLQCKCQIASFFFSFAIWKTRFRAHWYIFSPWLLVYKVPTHRLEVPESELLNRSHECYWAHTTLNVVFSVTYNWELCNAIIIYCTSQIFVNKCQIGCLDVTMHYYLYLMKKYNNNKKIGMWNSK